MPRVASDVKASLVFDATRMPVVVENVSCGGLSVRTDDAQLPSRMNAVLRVEPDIMGGRALEVPVTGTGRRLVKGSRSYGLRFHGYSGDRFRFIARIMFGDVSPIHARQVGRYVRLGVLAGTAVFMIAWIKQIGRGLAYLAARRAETAQPILSAKSERSAA